MDYIEYWDKIYEKSDEYNSLITSYWNDYSHMGTWQFWVGMFLLIAPLILLYFTIDRKRIFEIFFFGYTVHILWTYVSIVLERYSYFVHHYFITPILPFTLNITVSILPVGFLLMYQYCTNSKKNFYLYTILLSAVFAFGFASIEDWMGLVDFRKGANQLHIFFIDIVIAFLAYWFTKLIIKLKGRAYS